MSLFFSLDPNHVLFSKVVKGLGFELSPCKLTRFLDGEISFESLVSVSGQDVFIFHSFGDSVNEKFLELMIASDVMKKNLAKSITLVLPYICYSRQDRKFFKYGSIAFKLIADLLFFIGVNRVVVCDIHCIQTQGFFNVPLENISTIDHVARKLLKKINSKEVLIVSPDKGGVRRAKEFADVFGVNYCSSDKVRSISGECILSCSFIEVKNKDCLIVDDILGSGGTILGTIDLLHKNGASSVCVYVTHALFVGDSIEKFRKLYDQGILKKIFVSDSIKNNFSSYPFIEVISLDELLIDHIRIYLDS